MNNFNFHNSDDFCRASNGICLFVVHAVPSYKEHLYKEQLVDLRFHKERQLVKVQRPKERVH